MNTKLRICGTKLLCLLGTVFLLASTRLCHAQSGYLRNETGANPLDASMKKVIVLIHGWNPDNVSDMYASDPWSSLVKATKQKLTGSDWQLFTFHWEQGSLGANTGPIYDWQKLGFDVVGVGNAVAAGVYADAQGHRLATLLNQASPDLRRVQLIASSAGAWVAREAAADLLQSNPYVTVQVTLLDPFIPDVIPLQSTGLNDVKMSQLASVVGNDRISLLENYYADDFQTFAPTEQTFTWRSGTINDINQRVDWGLIYYKSHGGPIEFYQDTVYQSIAGNPIPSGLAWPSPLDYSQLGWQRSLFYSDEIRSPGIAVQPQNQSATSGSIVSLSVTASSSHPLSYQWFLNGQAVGGATSASYGFTLTSLNAGTYVVKISYQDQSGWIFSDHATVAIVTPAAPSVTTVSPPTFTGLPIGQRTPIRIIGSGFTSSSTLVFNDGTQNYNSNPAYLTFVSANEIDYNISTGTNQANWTVQVVNGAQTSNLGRFTVNAPSAPPQQYGSLVVNLSPAGAISAGAQWQVDGTGFNSSGQVVGYLTPGSHTVSFKAVSGYTTPVNQTVTINANAQTTTSGTYTTIAPSTYTLTLNYDNTQGGASASPLVSGNIYTAGAAVQIYASASSGYHFTGWGGDASGTNNPTTITLNGSKNVTANFAAGDPTMGTLVVTIQPPAAATAGVTWGFNANDYRASGSGYTTFPATYFITLHQTNGWLGSAQQLMTITAGQTTNYTVTFTPDTTPGLLTVTLSPPDVVAAGAQWQVNGNTYGSGASVALAPGTYTVNFGSIPGWAAPASQTATVQRSQTTIATGNYAPPAGQPSIVSIQPGVGALTGGTALTIQGLNFIAPATVLVGGQPANNVQVIGNSQIVCLTPSNSFYGTVPVVVQTTNGSATNLTSFAYGVPRGNGITLAGSIGGYVKAMAAQGSYAYTGEGSTFTVFDVSNPSAPTPVARLAMPGLVQDVALFSATGRQYAAVANYDAGLQIVDITTPTTPALRAYYNTGDYASGVAVFGTNVYVANGNSGLMILDVTNPLQPRKVSSLSIGNCDRLLVQTSGANVFAYVSDGGALAVVDVTSPANPTLRGATASITKWWEAHSLALLNNLVFYADGSGYLQAVDISNPNAPAALGSISSDLPSAVATANGLIYTFSNGGLQIYNFPGGPANRIGLVSISSGLSPANTMAILGGIALCTGGESGFKIFDVSTPNSPNYRGAYGATAGYYLAEAISGTNGFLATQNSGLKIVNVNNPAAPILQSQYIPSFNGGFGGQKVQVSGNRAYFVSANQINILDTSNPQAPSLLGANSTAQFLTQDLYILGNYVVAAGFDETTTPYAPAIEVFNVSNPASIGTLSKLDFATRNGAAYRITGNSNIACAAVPLASGSDFSLAVVNVSNPANLQQIGQLPDIGNVDAMRLGPENRYLYVGCWQTDLSWKIIDLANSNSPVLISSNYVGAAVFGFDFSGSTAFVATGNGVLVYDVSNPNQPQLLRSYNSPSLARDVKVSGNTLYVADSSGGFTTLALSDADPPEVFITGPTSSLTVTNTTGTLNLSGTADDSLGLVQGMIANITWANNQGGSGSATGTTNWSATNIILLPGTNILTVTATDTFGNSSNAILKAIYQATGQNQTITFPGIADHTFGNPPIQLVAAASSGLPVSFNVVSGPATLTSSNVLMLTGAGAVTVEANQLGNGSFNPATPVDVSFNVVRANQSIAFTPMPNRPASDPPFSISATSSSGLPVYLNVLSGPAVLDTNNVLTLLGGGTVNLVAWQPGNSSYNAAAPVLQSFSVSKIPQTITFGALSQQKVGDAPFSLYATSDSGLPVNFSVSGPTVLNGNILTLTSWGTVIVTASQTGNASYMAATNVVQSFFVVPPDNTIVAPQRLGNGSFQLAFYGLTGTNYLIQSSTNLVNWQPFTNFTGTNFLLYFNDSGATNFKQRFYRVRSQ